MIAKLIKAAMLTAALATAGCTASDLGPSASMSGGKKAEKQLSAKMVAQIKSKGMNRDAPIMARIFKEESTVEIWKQRTNGRYDLLASYEICKMSGKLGPKFIEGDRQAPEGFYTVRPAQMNPNSSYHLSFDMGYPNAYDRANGRNGTNLMVHGGCSSSGCYAVTDQAIEEIYALGRDAFRGGQTEFQIQSFPFRMTAANMARYRNDPNFEFWKMLKEGYDQFEVTKVPPKVDVCEKRYVFNRASEDGKPFNPTGACPMSTQPDTLATAYQTYQKTYDSAFAQASKKSDKNPAKASINGLKEANVVSDWTKKRARGERISIEPPSMSADGTVTQTTRMGRIDSEAGRRQAALDEAAEKKAKAEEEKKAIALAKAEEKRQADEAEAALAAAKAQPPEQAPVVATGTFIENGPGPAQVEPPAEKSGFLGNARKRIANLLGG